MELHRLREDIMEWMDSALILIDQLREENFKLRLNIPEINITEVPHVVRTDNARGVCECGRMEVRKHQICCDICYGAIVRKRNKASMEKQLEKENEKR